MDYGAWPFVCPISLQEVPNPALVRSQVEDGYPKVRRRFTKTWRTYQVSWRLEWDLYEAFWQFVSVDCGEGSIPFYMMHPITRETLLVRWSSPPQTQSDTSLKPVFVITGTLEEVFS
jgi:hypothetical protein